MRQKEQNVRPGLERTHRKPQASSLESGFTLVEIMVALGVMAIGCASVFALFAGATAIHKKAVDVMNAAIMADTVFAEVEDVLSATGTVNLSYNGSISAFPNYFYDVKLIDFDNSGNEFFVECEITWKERGLRRIEKFHTVLLRRLRFAERDKAIVPWDPEDTE